MISWTTEPISTGSLRSPSSLAADPIEINRLPLVVVRKRPLMSFHRTPPGSSSLLQVSINSEEVHISLRAAASRLAKGRGSMKLFCKSNIRYRDRHSLVSPAQKRSRLVIGLVISPTPPTRSLPEL